MILPGLGRFGWPCPPGGAPCWQGALGVCPDGPCASSMVLSVKSSQQASGPDPHSTCGQRKGLLLSSAAGLWQSNIPNHPDLMISASQHHTPMPDQTPCLFLLLLFLSQSSRIHSSQCPIKVGHSMRIFVLFHLNLIAEDD